MESPFLGSAVKTFPLYFEGSSGWWFGTFFIFPNSWDDDPIWRIFFRGLKPPISHACFRFLVSAWEVISQPGTAWNWVLNHDKSMISILMWPPWLVKQRPGPVNAVVAMARENQDVIKVPEHLHIGHGRGFWSQGRKVHERSSVLKSLEWKCSKTTDYYVYFKWFGRTSCLDIHRYPNDIAVMYSSWSTISMSYWSYCHVFLHYKAPCSGPCL